MAEKKVNLAQNNQVPPVTKTVDSMEIEEYQNTLNTTENSHEQSQKKHLVICLGEFGGIIKALGAFKIIQDNFPEDHITLLTYSDFKNFAKRTLYFDDIIEDKRDRSFWSSWRFSKFISAKKFDCIFDLQGSTQTQRLCKFLSLRGEISKSDIDTKTKWIGNSKISPFYQSQNLLKTLHPYERYYDLLKIADLHIGNKSLLKPDLSNLDIIITRDLPEHYLVMIPGSSPHKKEKRWPALFYAEIARNLHDNGVGSVIIGGKNEKEIAAVIKKKCPSALDFTDQTEWHEVLGISQKSCGILGNDTGPLFLAYASGKPIFVPWSSFSNQELNAPKGDTVTLFKEAFLTNLSPHRVWHEIKKIIPKRCS